MSHKRKAEWTAASDGLQKAVKSCAELLFSLELEIVQKLSSLDDEHDAVWIREFGTFTRAQVVASAVFEASNRVFVVYKRNETRPFLKSTIIRGKIEQHDILPTRLGLLSDDETLEFYQLAIRDFDLPNMKFS